MGLGFGGLLGLGFRVWGFIGFRLRVGGLLGLGFGGLLGLGFRVWGFIGFRV